MQIQRAIIMVAGKGERLRPVSKTIPKPLVKVNGKRMIDTIIQALHKNNIYEIYVVVGYLKEAFYDLPKQYKGLQLIDNPYFDSYNNLASMYVARKYLDNVIVIDGDQIILDEHVLNNKLTRSGYACMWTDEETDEWLFRVNQKGIVCDCSKGGKSGFELFGISRWTRQDGKLLAKLVEQEFISENRNIYWDDIALFLYKDKFELGYYPMHRKEILEIDSFKELCKIDQTYQKWSV